MWFPERLKASPGKRKVTLTWGDSVLPWDPLGLVRLGVFPLVFVEGTPAGEPADMCCSAQAARVLPVSVTTFFVPGRIAAAPSFLFHLFLISHVSTWHTIRRKQDIQGEVKPPPSPRPLAVSPPCRTEHGAATACPPCDQHLRRMSGGLPLWVTAAPAVVHTRETVCLRDPAAGGHERQLLPRAHFPIFSMLAPYSLITRAAAPDQEARDKSLW